MDKAHLPRPGELVELTIDTLAFGGKGVARLGDFVVFVSGAVPGDVVRARVTKNKKRYAEARVEQVLTPSADRRPARCRSFGECGGCMWQDLDYQVQLDYKARQVAESLEHLGGLRDFELLPIMAMDDPWRYRNRADFSIGMTEQGAVVGFRPAGRWDSVLPLSECHLLDSSLERVRATVEAWLREQQIPGWDPRTGTGFARHLLARCAQAGNEVLVSLVTVPQELPGAARFVERLRAAHPEIVGVVHAVNGGQAEISSGLESETLWGRPFLLEHVAGITLKVSVDAFFQTNPRMADQLYGVVAREAGTAREAGAGTSERPPVIWDLYSGVGAIGLSLARGARAVLGIEAVAAAVADAHENAKLNGISNMEFLEGDVAKVLREAADGERVLPAGLERPDVVIVDPPRAGLSNKAIRRIGEVGAPRIVYVSCNPSTMGPNVAQFQQFGYRLTRVTPVDMFPHTPHVEAVGVLEASQGLPQSEALPAAC
jgi:23S rRNA (uracil1939-C5)-methyltransferase